MTQGPQHVSWIVSYQLSDAFNRFKTRCIVYQNLNEFYLLWSRTTPQEWRMFWFYLSFESWLVLRGLSVWPWRPGVPDGARALFVFDTLGLRLPDVTRMAAPELALRKKTRTQANGLLRFFVIVSGWFRQKNQKFCLLHVENSPSCVVQCRKK